MAEKYFLPAPQWILCTPAAPTPHFGNNWFRQPQMKSQINSTKAFPLLCFELDDIR